MFAVRPTLIGDVLSKSTSFVSTRAKLIKSSEIEEVTEEKQDERKNQVMLLSTYHRFQARAPAKPARKCPKDMTKDPADTIAGMFIEWVLWWSRSCSTRLTKRCSSRNSSVEFHEVVSSVWFVAILLTTRVPIRADVTPKATNMMLRPRTMEEEYLRSEGYKSLGFGLERILIL
ncbi:hypothetical protein GEV33_004656 [Tenebrio molitor]|uniref:Uncharacterized protein n=1 Tax=Tenebrio molitor TaxID=7067 RepID=A0A8J6LEA1_TENMO|nr:hypothetical protein GEV33_004656 [Tenebrio molitor]